MAWRKSLLDMLMLVSRAPLRACGLHSCVRRLRVLWAAVRGCSC
ncbi:unnamed protein product [Pelagomonas calceolata]|uniref:Uncharacterized protein n=1 Tax=Pelagomonas calceolata TaxID=35677 RepID=A0A8J2WER5_9STRA|nr:unnamed protein product [Pelagomonas calceolata]